MPPFDDNWFSWIPDKTNPNTEPPRYITFLCVGPENREEIY